MPPTTSYSFGDIILVPFPFTDQTAVKRRPAVVVSSDSYHKARLDLVIMAVTGHVRSASTWGETPIRNWRAAGLLKESAIKPLITTIEPSLVLRRLGRLDSETSEALRRALRDLLG